MLLFEIDWFGEFGAGLGLGLSFNKSSKDKVFVLSFRANVAVSMLFTICWA